MDKREVMLGMAGGQPKAGYVPAAFFLHFDEAHRGGAGAVNRHLEFFRSTGMDFVKIQYEHPFPRLPDVREPGDWARISAPGIDHYEEPLRVVEGIVKAARREAVVVLTVYSALMQAVHATSPDLLTAHLDQDPEPVARGLAKIAESILLLVRAGAKLGLDGFYLSTQGGEAGRFAVPGIFERFIKPSDLLVMREAERLCRCNILHVCDYHGDYEDLAPYREYPGHIVNAGLRLRSGRRTPREIEATFDRPFLGGMDRHGVLAGGPPERIRAEVGAVLREAPRRFLLGADCTVPSETPWENLKAAVDAAHAGAAAG
jgi:uroporphyrinogen decarboxylase